MTYKNQLIELLCQLGTKFPTYVRYDPSKVLSNIGLHFSFTDYFKIILSESVNYHDLFLVDRDYRYTIEELIEICNNLLEHDTLLTETNIIKIIEIARLESIKRWIIDYNNVVELNKELIVNQQKELNNKVIDILKLRNQIINSSEFNELIELYKQYLSISEKISTIVNTKSDDIYKLNFQRKRFDEFLIDFKHEISYKKHCDLYKFLYNVDEGEDTYVLKDIFSELSNILENIKHFNTDDKLELTILDEIIEEFGN